ncbi:MAG: hypothetical protein IVW57_16170 [Ktedonobacterales bacterium]|nr:hypothetical protein [Ktedonobacterales bacterium]
MPAKSFIGEIEEAARHFYATALRGEVSDANVRGYLRAASQIEEVWQQVDDRLAQLTTAGTPPWEAYAQLRYPLAFIRAARTYQVFVRELLAADAAFDPATRGYLPRLTYDQANALCHQIQPNLQHAIAALHNATYEPDVALPLEFGPRIDAEDHACPVTHLQGMIGAARETREWAAGLIAQYEHAITIRGTAAPADATAHVTALNGQLAQADSQLRFGTDLVGQVSQGHASRELHEQAEDTLWQAMGGYFLINQAVALPEALRAPAPAAPGASRGTYRDRRITPSDLWQVSAPSSRSELRGTPFGTNEMREMCQKMGGVLSASAQRYLDEVDAAAQRGDVYIIAAMANCPFEPLYRARRPLELAGAQIPAGYEFHWDFHRGHVEAQQRFSRAGNWQECQE